MDNWPYFLVALGLVWGIFLTHRVQKLWVAVRGVNGKPGEWRMASQHDIRNLEHADGLMLLQIEQLQKFCRKQGMSPFIEAE